LWNTNIDEQVLAEATLRAMHTDDAELQVLLQLDQAFVLRERGEHEAAIMHVNRAASRIGRVRSALLRMDLYASVGQFLLFEPGYEQEADAFFADAYRLALDANVGAIAPGYLYQRMYIALGRGKYDEADMLNRERQRVEQELGKVEGVGNCAIYLGVSAMSRGRRASAEEHFAHNLRLIEAFDDQDYPGWALLNFAWCALEFGDFAAVQLWCARVDALLAHRTWPYQRENRAILDYAMRLLTRDPATIGSAPPPLDVPDQPDQFWCSRAVWQARHLLLAGDLSHARALLEQVIATLPRFSLPALYIVDRIRYTTLSAQVLALSGAHRIAAERLIWTIETCVRIDAQLHLVRAIEAALLLLAPRDPTVAQRLLGYVGTRLADLSARRTPFDTHLLDRYVAPYQPGNPDEPIGRPDIAAAIALSHLRRIATS
jgi:tetratricopeptide (TPR) repeat protein